MGYKKSSFLLLTAAFFTLTSMLPPRANFSGEWKLNESKSNFETFPGCLYYAGDSMRSKKMKIAGHVDFLTVDVANLNGQNVFTSQEKLTFDGIESEFNTEARGKKYTVNWSDNGLTMTVHSHLVVTGNAMVDRNHVKEEYQVVEVWKLINGGKSISIQTYLKSPELGERYSKRVYDKIS